MKDRAVRRKAEVKQKIKAKKILKQWGVDTTGKERMIGRLASVHGAACSCEYCGSPRRRAWGNTEDRLTMAERRQRDRELDLPKEVG